jgi:hypothetical protein
MKLLARFLKLFIFAVLEIEACLAGTLPLEPLGLVRSQPGQIVLKTLS